MKALALLLLAGCFGVTTTVRPRPVRGWLAPEGVEQFHRSHQLSVTANEDSVSELAFGDGDAGVGWVVCVERGEAKIQNHKTQQEVEDGW